MKTLAMRNKQKFWRLYLFCFVFMLAALAATIADASQRAAPLASRNFWIAGPQGTSRTVHATLSGSGSRSLLYVEDKYLGREISRAFLNRLEWQLETAAPAGAYVSGTGIIPLEERLFNPLPHTFSDDRLVVLFVDLGANPSLDGFFDPADQLLDADALKKYSRHSNEANLVYVNGLRKTENYTTGVVARELQRLLATSATASPRESWLADSLAEGATLLTGIFSDQPHVNNFLDDTGQYPLVSPGGVQHGPQLLFASFLLDSFPTARDTALGSLNDIDKTGRDTVEDLFEKLTDVPLTFDAIFSNFVSYVFSSAEGSTSLPNSWPHNSGIALSKVGSFFTYKAGSGELTASLAPYSFVAIDLAQELSPSAIIQVQRVPPAPGDKAALNSCAASASVLWKPVKPTRLAVYAVGCDPSDKPEMVQFRLKILDQPSLLPASPLKLFR